MPAYRVESGNILSWENTRESFSTSVKAVGLPKKAPRLAAINLIVAGHLSNWDNSKPFFGRQFAPARSFFADYTDYP